MLQNMQVHSQLTVFRERHVIFGVLEFILTFRFRSSSLSGATCDAIFAIRTEYNLVVVFALRVRFFVADFLLAL